MGLLQRIKALISTTPGTPLSEVVKAGGIATDSGQLVTLQTASRVATYTGGIKLLANDISSLPLHLMMRTKNGPEYAVNHPLYYIVSAEWNPELTAREGMEHSVRMLLACGNFFNFLDLDANTAEVRGIYPLYAPDVVGRRLSDYEMERMGLIPGKDSNLAWDYSDQTTATIKTFHDSSIWRASINGKYALVGEGLVTLGKHTLGTAIAADKSSARLFKKGTISDVYFQPEVGKDISDDEWRKLVLAWERGADGSYTKPVVPEGIKVSKLEAPTAQQAQFIERAKRQDLEICRLLNIPASILDANEKGETFAASESQRRWYVTHTLRPYLTLIEQSINARCLSKIEKTRYYAEFDTDVLTYPDMQARYTANKEALGGASFKTINEVRKDENLPPKEGGDVLLVPANNLGTLDKSGKIIPPQQPQSQSNTRLQALARYQAERIVRKELKKGERDPEYVADELCISRELAQQYCDKRASGEVPDADAVQALVSLAIEVTQ